MGLIARLGVLVALLAALGGAGYGLVQWGRSLEHADELKRELAQVAEKQRLEEAAAAQVAASAARVAEKEKLLNEQAKRQTVKWRALVAGLPECRIPAAVGVQLDAAAGSVPATPTVARPPVADPDEAALAATIDLAETLDRVRENYAICRVNAERLTEARGWYTDLRTLVNSGVQP